MNWIVLDQIDGTFMSSECLLIQWGLHYPLSAVSCQRMKRNIVKMEQGRGSSIFVPWGLSLYHVSICFCFAAVVLSMTRQLGSLSPILHLPDTTPKQRQDRNYFAWDKTMPHCSYGAEYVNFSQTKSRLWSRILRILKKAYLLGNLTCYHPSTNFDFANVFFFSLYWRRT